MILARNSNSDSVVLLKEKMWNCYLWPFRIELLSFDGILKCFGELAHFDVGSRPVAVQDVIGRVQLDGLRVQGHGAFKVPALAGCVGLPNLFQKGRLGRVRWFFFGGPRAAWRIWAHLKIILSYLNEGKKNIHFLQNALKLDNWWLKIAISHPWWI